MNFNFVKNRKYFYVFSIILTALTILALFLWGLKLGVDFKGGNLAEVRFERTVTVEEINKVLTSDNLSEATVKRENENTFLINLPQIESSKYSELKLKISKEVGNFEELRLDSVGPTVSKTIRNRAILAIVLVLVLISLYIAYAFRQASRAVSSWRYGLATMVALVHDIFLTVGFYALFGHFKGAFIDINFIVVLLVVLGFSVHDTIVVFDRVRENVLKTKTDFDDVVNISLNQTVIRSISTSLTTIIALVAILIFAGSILDNFVSPLIFGIAVGTYSSIFIASALLVDWQNKKISQRRVK